jgi:hypothetical protein
MTLAVCRYFCSRYSGDDNWGAMRQLRYAIARPNPLFAVSTSRARPTSSNARFTDGFFARAALCLASVLFCRYRGDIRGRRFLWYAEN